MYLSRVQLDTDNRQKIRNLTHLGAYHDWVERSFPEEFAEGERTRKLWRIDHLGGKIYLLIVSREAPDLSSLCCYGVDGSAETKNYDPFLSKLKKGMKCRFRIVLNPVVAVLDRSGKRGAYHAACYSSTSNGLFKEAVRATWLFAARWRVWHKRTEFCAMAKGKRTYSP